MSEVKKGLKALDDAREAGKPDWANEWLTPQKRKRGKKTFNKTKGYPGEGPRRKGRRGGRRRVKGRNRGGKAKKRAQGGAPPPPNIGSAATWSDIGSKAGGWLGNLAHKGISKILGMGDYQAVSPEHGVSSNSFLSPVKQVPIMHSDQFGCIRISHREFLTDIQGTNSGAQRYQFVLNPGDARTFPWLSNLSGSFEQYKLLGMCFEFRSTCGDAVSSTNSALGTVCVATTYDVLNPQFGSKTDILNHFWSGSAKPSVNQLHCIECEPSVTPLAPLYIRHGQLGINSTYTLGTSDPEVKVPVTFQEMFDARMYDHGRTELIVTGQQAQFAVGELWISYDLLLLKPRRVPANQLNTYEGPPSIYAEPVLSYNTYPEVPLTAVLPISDGSYPSELKEVDFE